MNWRSALPLGLGLLLSGACLGGFHASAGGAAPSSGGQVRIASYNIEWLRDVVPPLRRERLKKVISGLNPSILGFQEVESSRAIAPILGEDWTIAMDDSGEQQEVGLAVRKPFVLKDMKMLFSEHEYDSAFPKGRNLLRAEVGGPGGFSLAVYVVHLKSRAGEGRAATDERRLEAAGLIAQAVKSDPLPNIAVMGDFNDAPGDESLTVLKRQSGLKDLMDPLYDDDWVSVDLNRYRGARYLSEPRIRGAKAENERYRSRRVNYERDVKIKPALFDQILVSPKLAQKMSGSAGIYWASGILEGTSVKRGSAAEGEGDRASDHLPVYADFRLP